MKQTTKKTKQSIIGAVTFMMGMLGYQVSELYFEKRNFNRSIEEFVTYINEACPYAIDSDTRMDSVVYLPPKTLLYHYTLVHIAKEDLREDIDQMLKLMEGSIIFNLRQSPDIGAIGRQGVIFGYEYKDMNGQHIHTFDITPEKYKN